MYAVVSDGATRGTVQTRIAYAAGGAIIRAGSGAAASSTNAEFAGLHPAGDDFGGVVTLLESTVALTRIAGGAADTGGSKLDASSDSEDGGESELHDESGVKDE